ncbi:MAG TPA: TetR-like C-terminal domain-containing protein [Actinomycetota bacterium]|nr:TetR-like C-terminal domain-containing protein [Actinomycetota bacterium]
MTSGVRARNRQAKMAAITRVANEQLAVVGPAELSVRAVARELGMASSAIYRYVESRDALLTLLIIAAYDDMAQRAEVAAAGPRDPLRRWLAAGLACRDWALDQPHRFALIFGSPVLGYAAPQETIGPASRIPALLTGVLQQAGASPDVPAFSARVAASLRPLRADLAHWAGIADPRFSDAALALGVLAWTHLIGSISFELFGHRHNVVGDSPADRRTYFEFELRVLAGLLGID